MNLTSIASKAVQFAAERKAAIATVSVGSFIVLGPGIVAGVALKAFGFTSAGVAATSAAAGVHAGIGNAAAGSTFAVLQSAGAGGPGLGVIVGAVKGAGTAIVGAGTALLFRKKKTDEAEPKGEKNKDA